MKEVEGMIPKMPAEQQEAMKAQLEEAQEFATPMLLDYIWWRTCGEVEWEEVDEEVNKILNTEMQKGNKDFQRLIFEF